MPVCGPIAGRGRDHPQRFVSKSPFNKYKAGLSPVQVKVVQDYIARIRAQMVQVLKSQDISIPPPEFEARRSIRVNLEFADIAF